MESQGPTFWQVTYKTVVVHTVTYFLIGLLAYTLFDYTSVFAEADVRGFMRQTDDPMVAVGPLFQPLRGILFALAFYPLREVLFGKQNGWLVTWLVLVMLGIFSTFGPSPGSIEGMIYTTWPLSRHLGGLIEILVQSCLLSWLLFTWVNHPRNRWLGGGLIAAFVIAMALPLMGVLAKATLPGA